MQHASAHAEPTPLRPRLVAARAGTHLADIARNIARAEPLWRPSVRHDPEHRGFVRLYATPEVEAWVLTWSCDQAIALHDHGGSAGGVMVVEGELVETFTDLRTRAPLRQARWGTGSLHFFDGNHVHDLQHVGPADATSIHVYSPPLGTMTFYDHRPSTYLRPIRREPVAVAPPPVRHVAQR